MLSHVSWALAQISCLPGWASNSFVCVQNLHPAGVISSSSWCFFTTVFSFHCTLFKYFQNFNMTMIMITMMITMNLGWSCVMLRACADGWSGDNNDRYNGHVAVSGASLAISCTCSHGCVHRRLPAWHSLHNTGTCDVLCCHWQTWQRARNNNTCKELQNVSLMPGTVYCLTQSIFRPWNHTNDQYKLRISPVTASALSIALY